MKFTTLRLRILLFGAGALMLGPLAADEIAYNAESRQTNDLPVEYKTTENRLAIAKAHTKHNRPIARYIPPAPLQPTPQIRIATGGTRSLNNGFPIVALLVPEHMAYTVKEQPTLYWHISQTTQKPVVLTLIELDAVKPLLEEPLQNLVPRNIQALKLANYGIRLQPNKIYEWSVRIIEDPNDPSGDAIARSFIQRVIPNAEISAALEQSDPLSRAQAYARNGIWHDALATLMEGDSSSQAQDRLRRARDWLLGQVELKQVVNSIIGADIHLGSNL